MFVPRRIRVPVRPWALLAAVAATSFAVPGAVRAQARSGAETTVMLDEAGRATPIRRPGGFSLFGNQDLAFAGMHGTGNMRGFMSNVGPCETGIFAQRCLSIVGFGAGEYFELAILAGVPRGDWIKNRDIAPSLRNARGEGYSQMRNDLVFTSKMEIGPKDNTLGTLFSGTTATTDGSCLDNSSAINGGLTAGLQLLASSNCTATWPAATWLGDRPIPTESWVGLFQSQGAAFTFDFSRVPATLKQQTRFMGTNFATYGAMSDHHSGIRASYGSVIPGGIGDPTNDGWPLGLDFEFQAFNYALPTVQSVVYYQMLVINNSAQVYGVGLDYDSLYLGLAQGLLLNGSQAPGEYFEPGRGAAVFASNGVNVLCNTPLTPTGVGGCNRPGGGSLGARGGDAVIFLRSPIGDLRNKLFTRVGSAFYMPGHPLAGDTITFNHGHACGFSACSNNVPRFNDQRGFGLLSSTEENVLQGRTAGSIPAAEYWLSFRSRAFPTQDGKFNKWVPPGNWDYNADGILDTLSLESCGGATGSAFVTMANGCIVTFSDTMPGKQNNTTGNIGGAITAGPIQLAAGDTTTFMFAFVAERDSAKLVSAINNAIDFYQSFFFGPEPPVVPDIVSSEVAVGGDLSVVNLFFNDAPERWVDPFLIDFAAKVTSAAPGTELARLRTLNPTFISQITTRANDNLQEIQVFKSCDGGATFTGDADCTPDPAVDEVGNNVGVGWRAYRILRRADFAGGDIPNVFQDLNVTGGHTYLYVMAGKSRGGVFPLSDSLDTNGDGLFDAIGGRDFTAAPQLINSLSRSASDPNVISVYVPFSNQAGSTSTQVALTAQQGGATVPFGLQFTGTVVPGTYRAVFGNNIRIVEVHSPVLPESVITSTVRLIDSVVTGAATSARFDTLFGVSTAPRGVPFAAALCPTPPAAQPAGCAARTIIGDTTFYYFSSAGTLGFVLVNASGTPLFASTTLTGTPATPASFFASRDYTGFVVSVDNRNAGTFAAETTLENGVFVAQANVNSFRVQWRQETAIRTIGTGNYHVRWTADPFGVQRGFNINFGDPTVTAAALADSLSARTATPAATDTGLAAILGVDPATIRPARLPFTITNRSTGRAVTVVAFTRLSNTMVLGDGEDTVRLNVPATEWIPGDRLALIEDIDEDSVVVGTAFVVLGTDGRPLRATRKRVTFSQAILGCNQPRESCNPTRPGTRGAGTAAGTGYVALTSNTLTTFHYFVGLNRYSDYTGVVTAGVSGTGITAVTRTQLDSIRVVPNPFVAFSTFQTAIDESRVVFTHLPPRGSLRIYSVSGQMIQRITWTESDLGTNGDLHYNLRTREGTDIATGMYIWVLNTDIGGRRTARGKFVVIRSRAN